MRVEVTGAAARQIIEAAEWWEAKRQHAPRLLLDELSDALSLLEAGPLRLALSDSRDVHLGRQRWRAAPTLRLAMAWVGVGRYPSGSRVVESPRRVTSVHSPTPRSILLVNDRTESR